MTSAPTTTPRTPSGGLRRPGRRWLLLVVPGALIGCLALAVLSIRAVDGLRGALEEGRAALERAQDSLLEGNLEEAASSFSQAEATLRRSTDHPGAIVLRTAGFLPFLGRTPDAALSIAEVGRQVASVGADVTDAVLGLSGGLSALTPTEGRIPIETFRSLAPIAREASASLEQARATASRLPESWLLDPVADARDLLRDRLERVASLARAAAALFAVLPDFAGEDRPRRYFIAAQNSAEMRGTGGLIGNHAILTLDKGQMSFGPFRDSSSLPNLPVDEVAAPSEDFARLYNAFGGAGFWLNINMTPDARTAATLIEELYHRVKGRRVDGTIFLDLTGLSYLLEATGPVRVPELDTTITRENFVPYVASGAYREGRDRGVFGEGAVAEAIWDRFINDADPERAFRALIRAAADGHLMLHASDDRIQSAFELAGVAGRFGWQAGDFFATVINNAAANKVDYYARQDVRYLVQLEADGAASATAMVRLMNLAPAGADPSYALGPDPVLIRGGHDLVPGESRSYVTFYCPARCRLASATAHDGIRLGAFREQGLSVFGAFVEVEPQDTAEFGLALEVDDVWTGDHLGGIYRLRLQGQPALPTTATVVVRAPEGLRIGSTSSTMTVLDGEAVWRGELGRLRDFWVRFEKPLPARLWLRAWDFLSKPVIRL